MTVELLAIVQAEEQADALVREAQEQKARAIKQALEKRQAALSGIAATAIAEPKLRPLNPDLASLKAQAHRNKRKAINAILEELGAQ